MSNLIRAYIIHLITWISTLSKVRWHHKSNDRTLNERHINYLATFTKVQSVPLIHSVLYFMTVDQISIYQLSSYHHSAIVNLINPNPIVNALSNWILHCHWFMLIFLLQGSWCSTTATTKTTTTKKKDLKSTFHCLSQTTIFKWSNWCKYHTL